MINKILAFVFFLFIALTINAQGDYQKKDHRLDRITDHLELTADQQARIATIFSEDEIKKEAIRNDELLDFRQKKIEIKKIHEAQHTKIVSVLNAEQQEKFEKVGHKKRRAHRGKKGMDKKMAWKEIKAYHQKEIQPVLYNQRLKLEEKITAADKELIADLRLKVAAEKEEHKKNWMKLKQEVKAKKQAAKSQKGEACCPEQKTCCPDAKSCAPEGDKKRVKRKRKKKVRLGQQMPSELKTQIGDIVQKYRAEIDQLHQEIEPQQAQWDKDIKAIHAKNSERGRRHSMKRSEGAKHEKAKDKKAAHFLLMDVDQTKETTLADQSSVIGIKLFPNPSSGTTKFSYEVIEDGLIVIQLLNASGNLVQEILKEERKMGSYTELINLDNLQSSNYIVTIQDKYGIQSETLIVTKQ